MPRARASLLVMLTTAITTAVLFCLPYTPARTVQTTLAYRGELMRYDVLRGLVSYARQQPCLSLQAGQIEGVFVEPGQKVQKGDLLFSMDTAIQESALANLYQSAYQRQNLLQSVEEITGVSAQVMTEVREYHQQLIASIDAAKIRAPMDGIVEAAYVRAGDWVEQGKLLSSLHSGEKCVNVALGSEELHGIEQNTAALEHKGYSLGAAKLEELDGTLIDGQLVRQASFVPLRQEQLAKCRIGDAVDVILIRDAFDGGVLIPLSAVDLSGQVWYVDNGRAKAEKIDTSVRNESFVAVSSEWEGRHVILAPEGLSDGCAVREAFQP